jgi:hypothetical protein
VNAGKFLKAHDTGIALLEFLNAVEAGISAARQLIKEAKIGWSPDQTKWEETQGTD